MTNVSGREQAALEKMKDVTVKQGELVKIGKPREFVPFPDSFNEAMKICQIIAESDMIPKEYRAKPANVFIAVAHGVSIGLDMMQAVQNIKVINGQPSVWGDTALALVRASGLLEEWDEWLTSDGQKIGDDENILKLIEAKKNVVAHCRSKRPGMNAQEHCFSVEDARIAGLWGKEGAWRQYHKRMLRMRARGFNLRDGYSDVLRGLNLIEAAWDSPPEETSTAAEIAQRSQPDTKGVGILEKISAVEQDPKEKRLASFGDAEAVAASAKEPPPDLIVEDEGKGKTPSELDVDISNAEGILKGSEVGQSYLVELWKDMKVKDGAGVLELQRGFYLKNLILQIDRINSP